MAEALATVTHPLPQALPFLDIWDECSAAPFATWRWTIGLAKDLILLKGVTCIRMEWNSETKRINFIMDFKKRTYVIKTKAPKFTVCNSVNGSNRQNTRVFYKWEDVVDLFRSGKVREVWP